jgi:hypothetical protein
LCRKAGLGIIGTTTDLITLPRLRAYKAQGFDPSGTSLFLTFKTTFHSSRLGKTHVTHSNIVMWGKLLARAAKVFTLLRNFIIESYAEKFC